MNVSTLPSRAGFRIWRPGRLPYRDALVFQERLVAARSTLNHDLLILLEHPRTITLGRNLNRQSLRCNDAQLAAAGIELVETTRGGDVTCHEPGQLVGYPIVDLTPADRDLHRYLRNLEQVLIRTLADFDLQGHTVRERTGVWVGARKIASIGIAIRRWISWHGFALNINNDLSGFDVIDPCGLPEVAMTSMQRELGRALSEDAVTEAVIRHFADIFGLTHEGDYDPTTA